MKTQKAFITANNEILIVTATTEGCGGRKYVSVTADTIAPMTYEAAKDRSRESLEDGEGWRMAVAAEQTELGLSDWIEMVLNVDGAISQIDNSLYSKIVTIEGENYVFDSLSCGCLHDDIKECTNKFDRLIELHLEGNEDAISEAEKIIASIKSDDIDSKVEKLTKKILQLQS